MTVSTAEILTFSGMALSLVMLAIVLNSVRRAKMLEKSAKEQKDEFLRSMSKLWALPCGDPRKMEITWILRAITEFEEQYKKIRSLKRLSYVLQDYACATSFINSIVACEQ